MTLNEYIARIRRNIKDTSNELEDDDLVESINNALKKLSLDFPKINFKIYSYSNVNSYDLPDDWSNGFSSVNCIKIENENETRYLEEDNYLINEKENRFEIRNYDLINGDNIIFYYNVFYQIDEEENEVKGALILPLIYLASSIALFSLSQKYSHLYETREIVDINLNKKIEQLIRISEKYKEKYEDIIDRLIYGGYETRSYIITKNYSSNINSDCIFH